MDDECAEYFNNKYKTIEVKRSNYEKRNSVSYKEDDWNGVTLQKINVVSLELRENAYVVLFDGDIVFNSINFIEHIRTEMNKDSTTELIVQNEYKNKNSKELCSGFYCVKSTPNTLQYFDPSMYVEGKFNSNDQDYLNKISKHFNWKFLDIELFPNGSYYYDHHQNPDRAYIVHFNFVKFKEKEGRMRRYKMWYL